MYDVRNNFINKFFLSEITLVTQSLLNGHSIFFTCYNIKFNFILDYINNEYIREVQLKKRKDDFIFIEINKDSYEDLLTILTVGLLHKAYNFRPESLSEVNKYLTQSDKILVAYTDETDIEFQQQLYSLKYYFGSRILFIFSDNKERETPDEFINIELTGRYFEEAIKNRLEKLNLNLDPILILRQMDQNIELLDEAIIKVLSNQKGSVNEVQESSQLNKSTSIEVAQPKRAIKSKPSTLNKKDAKELNLTERENEIYKVLKSKKFISRERIATIAWGEEGKTASDDAIDQVISRLRKKLVQSGFDKSYITSKKGEGVEIRD